MTMRAYFADRVEKKIEPFDFFMNDDALVSLIITKFNANKNLYIEVHKKGVKGRIDDLDLHQHVTYEEGVTDENGNVELIGGYGVYASELDHWLHVRRTEYIDLPKADKIISNVPVYHWENTTPTVAIGEEFRDEFIKEYGKTGQNLDLTRLPHGQYRSMVTHYAWVAFRHGKGILNPNDRDYNL